MKKTFSSILSLFVLTLFLFSCSFMTPPTSPQPDKNGSNGSSGVVTTPTSGVINATMHPGSQVAINSPTTVVFSVPFPKGAVNDVQEIVVADKDGNEYASHIKATSYWHDFNGAPGGAPNSIRSALIAFETTLGGTTPVDIKIYYGAAKTLDMQFNGKASDHWVSIAGEVNPDEYPAGENIKEPAVYVTLSKEWLAKSGVQANVSPFKSNPEWNWFDEAFYNFGKTAVNDVSSHVTAAELIDYTTQAAPWLFDRAMTLYSLYLRTGELKWLRHAHRATQFFANHISAGGYIDLKSYDDLKYSYGQSFFTELLLVGDESMLTKIRAVATAADSWPVNYSASLNFWTERHLTYALYADLIAWEATGESAYRTKVKNRVDAIRAHQTTPPAGTPDGSLLHTMNQHEGSIKSGLIGSPWMTALLAGALLRYYTVSNDETALHIVSGFGDYVVNHALYRADVTSATLKGKLLPWYLASSAHTFTDSGPYADWEHVIDVMGLLIKSAWAKKQLSQDYSAVMNTFNEMKPTGKSNLDYWHRVDSDVNYGKAVWRLAPPRKFSWWFGSTTDMQELEKAVTGK